jgi:hypothetical protein
MLFLKIANSNYINPEQITSIKATNHRFNDFRVVCKCIELNGEYTDPDYIELFKIDLGMRYDKLPDNKKILLDQFTDKLIQNLIESINSYNTQGANVLDLKEHFKKYDTEIQQLLKEIQT